MNQVINKQKCPKNTQVSIGGGRRRRRHRIGAVFGQFC